MPFAHCTDCGTPALIDPSGRCPEGHEVGHAGARVAAGIGSSAPHPDEPKPWVGVVDIDPIRIDSQPLEPRVALPPSLPDSQATTPATATEAVAPAAASSDDLLRELHALGDLDGLGDLGADGPAAAPPRPTPTPAPATPSLPTSSLPSPAPAPRDPVPPVPPTNLAVTPGSPAPPSSPEEATGLDELASLAAAIGSLDDRDAVAAAPVPPPLTAPPAAAPPAAAPAPTPPASVLDELWAAAEPSPRTPPTAAAPPAPPAPATPPPAPAPTAASFGATAPPPAPVPVTAPPGPPPAVDAAAEPVTSPFDGSFTARGVGRRTQRRLDEKAAKKGLFRR